MGKLKEKIRDLMGISLLDTIYKQFTYRDIFITAFPAIQRRVVGRLRVRQQIKVGQCRKKERLNVMFFLQTESIWKYDNLYRILEKSDRFRPIVVVSPYNVHLNYSREECFRVMRQAVEFAGRQGYNYVSAYDFAGRKWLNVKKMYEPDIVFFSKPYKDTLPAYHIYNFKDCLTLYAPYGLLTIDNYHSNYNLPFNNLLWRMLSETEFQKGYAQQYSLCGGDNAIVVGCLGTEKLIDPAYRPSVVWKPQDKPKKRIIWAPHHTVDYLFNFSNFLAYCDTMLELAEKFKDSVQFAFKPHPVLKFKLINIWGAEKTEAYYHRWESMDNTQLENGYYMDLFLTSDAMIHDCASFTAEYLYTRKPVLFMVRDEKNVLSHWNTFGHKCYDVHYHAPDVQAIEDFINDVVIGGNDTMKTVRDEFFDTYLYPKDGVMPSVGICRYLSEILGR